MYTYFTSRWTGGMQCRDMVLAQPPSTKISMGHVGTKVNIYIDKTGPGEVYVQAKVIRIYANTVGPGGRQEFPDIDFRNYEAVTIL